MRWRGDPWDNDAHATLKASRKKSRCKRKLAFSIQRKIKPMRPFSHWTPRYVVDRTKVFLDQRREPEDPWLTRQAIDIIEPLLRAGDDALEFGSGRSTLWLARHVKRLTSIEHDTQWHATITEKLRAANIVNVELLLRPMDVAEADGEKSAYVKVLDRIGTASIDFALVDGMYRNFCALGMIPKREQELFLPSTTLTGFCQAKLSRQHRAVWNKAQKMKFGVSF